MVFTLLSGWKYLKNNLFWDMKTLWNSVSSVHKNRFVETQPCLIVYVLSMAALILQWQRWIGETMWPANLVDLLTGPLQKKTLPNLFLGHWKTSVNHTFLGHWKTSVKEVQSHDHPHEETTNLPILPYFFLLSVIYTISTANSPVAQSLLCSQTALFLFLPLL